MLSPLQLKFYLKNLVAYMVASIRTEQIRLFGSVSHYYLVLTDGNSLFLIAVASPGPEVRIQPTNAQTSLRRERLVTHPLSVFPLVCLCAVIQCFLFLVACHNDSPTLPLSFPHLQLTTPTNIRYPMNVRDLFLCIVRWFRAEVFMCVPA